VEFARVSTSTRQNFGDHRLQQDVSEFFEYLIDRLETEVPSLIMDVMEMKQIGLVTCLACNMKSASPVRSNLPFLNVQLRPSRACPPNRPNLLSAQLSSLNGRYLHPTLPASVYCICHSNLRVHHSNPLEILRSKESEVYSVPQIFSHC